MWLLKILMVLYHRATSCSKAAVAADVAAAAVCTYVLS